MATPSDQQLIQFIQQGRRDALAQLFDRYSADLYDFLARLVGDRDEAARLLEEVFMRVPGAVAGLPARESVRGWLYSLAREAGLTQLRQRGWLDGLPPSEEPGPASMAGDIWRAARGMPAFYRAVLIVEELHALSPTEKARALGVQRTDLPRLVDEARKSFTRQFDALARAEGRMTSAQIDPDRILGLKQRINTPGASLFGLLPVLILPESLQGILRQRVLQAMTGQPLRPIEAAPLVETPPPPPPPVVVPVEEPPPPPSAITTTTTTTTRSGVFSAETLPAWALAALAGIALAVIVCGLVYLFLPKASNQLSVQAVQPPKGAIVPASGPITISATLSGPRSIDPLRTKLRVDALDLSNQVQSTPNSISWSGLLGLGPHTVSATIFDQAGNQASETWSFTVVAGSATAAASASLTFTLPSVTPLPTLTALPTLTPLPPTLTPVPTATPVPSLTPVPPSPTPIPPSPTPCLVGIFGKIFNDANANQLLDPGEPTLSNVTVFLQDATGRNLSGTASDALGQYQFVNLPFGTYRVAVGTPAGWYATTPTIVTVNMFGCGAFIGVDFGFNQATPTPIPTVTPTITPIIIVVTSTPTATLPPTPTPTFTLPPPTPTATATATTPVFAITNITLNVSPTNNWTSGCPAQFTVSGTITANGPGSIQYHWVRSNGVSSGYYTANLTVPPYQVALVPDTYWVGGGPPPTPSAGPTNARLWDRLEFVIPGPTPTLTPTPSPTSTRTPQPTALPQGADIIYFEVHCPF